MVLPRAPATVDFIPEDPGPFNDRISAEQQTQKVTVSLIGGLHGDFAPMIQKNQIEDLSALASKQNGRGFPGGPKGRIHRVFQGYLQTWPQLPGSCSLSLTDLSTAGGSANGGIGSERPPASEYP